MKTIHVLRVFLVITILSLFTVYTSAAPTSFAEVEESWQRGLSEVKDATSLTLSHGSISCLTKRIRMRYTKNQHNILYHHITIIYNNIITITIITLISLPHPNLCIIMKIKTTIQSFRVCWMHAQWLYGESCTELLGEEEQEEGGCLVDCLGRRRIRK
jgi:hypothetical protein